MRILPVIDLLGGAVVHAVRGARDRYRPVSSSLVGGAEPVAVARALLGATGSAGLYVADLDGIEGRALDRTALRAIGALAATLVDAGVDAPEGVDRVVDAGAGRVVLGTESLGAGALEAIAAARPAARVTLSVDLRDGALLSRDPALVGRPVEAVAALAESPIVTELLVLDLATVGSREGPALDAVRRLVDATGGALPVLGGGGVRDVRDLEALRDAGADGALVATALHTGAVTAADLAALRAG